VVEELLPATVALLAEMDMYEWIVFRLNGLMNKCYTSFFRSSTAFFDVALGAGTNYISPNGFTTHAPGDNMVE